MKPLLALLIVVSVSACGSDAQKGGPSGIVRVEILGAASLEPGQTASYSVVETRSDGSSRVLSAATWTSSDTSIVQIASSGMATAQARTGEAVIQVRTTAQGSASKEVLVLPGGTFRLVGNVTDAEAGGVPIPDTRVEVVDGPAATTSTTGTYRLYGVPQEADIRLTRIGYATVIVPVRLTGNTTRNFTLSVDDSVKNISGHYTLSIETAGNCSALRFPIPPDLRHRTYAAVVTQSASRLDLLLPEPRFQVDRSGRGNRFQGHLTPTGAVFTLQPPDYYDPAQQSDLLEQIEGGTLLSIYGTATTISAGSGFSGSLAGWFTHFAPSGPDFWLGDCPAGRLTLSPR